MYVSWYIPEPAASDSAKRHWDNNFNLLMATVEFQDFPTCEGRQRGFLSDAQDSIVFGRNEPALQHYHRSVTAALADPHRQMPAEQSPVTASFLPWISPSSLRSRTRP